MILGPTFACIIAQQFVKLKIGDRYFFTHNNTEVGFCSTDLSHLKKRTLRDVICDVVKAEALPLSVFHVPSELNPTFGCAENKNSLEPQDLCLFGVSKAASQIENPGYVEMKGMCTVSNLQVI